MGINALQHLYFAYGCLNIPLVNANLTTTRNNESPLNLSGSNHNLFRLKAMLQNV